METNAYCPQCGAERGDEDWPDGVCPACLMKLGLSGIVDLPAAPADSSASTEPFASVEAPLPSGPGEPPASTRGRTWLVTLAALAVLTLLLVVFSSRTPAEEPPAVVRFSFAPPPDVAIGEFALSPDGRQLAFTATDDDGETRLWLRPLAQPDARELVGTEGASQPFWSPDSRHVGFFAGGRLHRVGLDAGRPVVLAQAPGEVWGGSWSDRGEILFAVAGRGVLRVAAAGGSPEPVLSADLGGLGPAWPVSLPGGRSFLFSSAWSEGGGPEIFVASLESGAIEVVESNASFGMFSDDHLLFLRDGMLMARAFDLDRLQPRGDPLPVHYAESVRAAHRFWPGFSAGRGVIAFFDGGSNLDPLFWIDRRGGTVEAARLDPVAPDGFALSPDGSRVAATRAVVSGGGEDLFVTDLAQESSTRLTFDAPGAFSPVWSPDGQRIAFAWANDGRAAIGIVAVEGSAVEVLSFEGPGLVSLDDWSPDGRLLLYTAAGRGVEPSGVWTLSVDGGGEAQPAVVGSHRAGQARLSPDGRWLAYVSTESGREEVVVRRVANDEARWMVSTAGGTRPAWSPDGRALYYQSPQGALMAVDVSGADAFQWSLPRLLFRAPGSRSYQVAPDGSRFLVAMGQSDGRVRPIHAVLNWTHELAR